MEFKVRQIQICFIFLMFPSVDTTSKQVSNDLYVFTFRLVRVLTLKPLLFIQYIVLTSRQFKYSTKQLTLACEFNVCLL
jgi:hypothetical protein